MFEELINNFWEPDLDGQGGPPGEPPGGGPDGRGGSDMGHLWPLWGTFFAPTPGGVLLAIIVFGGFVAVLWGVNRRETLKIHAREPPQVQELENAPIESQENGVFPRTLSKLLRYLNLSSKRLYLLGIALAGILLIFCTNLFHGWDIGIENSIGGDSELYQDAIQITSAWDFIANYENLQETLTVHAQTQPPGAVLTIYVLYKILGSASLVAIGLCVITTLLSTFFLHGLLKRFFNEKNTRFGTVLFLVLPAVQVYYLANVYAFVATWLLGVCYFYWHPNRVVSLAGGLVCLFLASFTTFLFVWVVLFLGLFELLQAHRQGLFKRALIREVGLWGWLRFLWGCFWKLILLCGGLVALYLGLFVSLGFNYLNAFFFASALENPNGFMLFTDPAQYFITRLQNVLDIMVFFGPPLLVLAYLGIKLLRDPSGVEDPIKERQENAAQLYAMVVAAIVALGLLFLTGAPKKGETARICMFILPMLLVPVIAFLDVNQVLTSEKFKLLGVVFGQAVLMQLVAIYVW
ncbi:MAG: hypothetical protein ACTSU5_22005 [Promethearchaeota archaeon]